MSTLHENDDGVPTGLDVPWLGLEVVTVVVVEATVVVEVEEEAEVEEDVLELDDVVHVTRASSPPPRQPFESETGIVAFEVLNPTAREVIKNTNTKLTSSRVLFVFPTLEV